MNELRKHPVRGTFAVMVVVLMVAISVFPIMSHDDSDAAGSYFTYTLTNGPDTSIIVTAEGAPLKDFDSNGYGPFKSFYAAFDSSNNNRMICHLNPYNLKQAITNTIVSEYASNFTPVDGTDYCAMDETLLGNANIMWCLPTIYWYVDNGSLVMTDNPDSGGTAFAHTINSKSGGPYNYLAIGVYEAYNNGGFLMSKTSILPSSGVTLTNYRTYANNVVINTAGTNINGDAGLWNYYQYQLYRLCSLSYAEDYNVPAIIGYGNIYGSGAGAQTVAGKLDASGPYAGKPDESFYQGPQEPAKLFIENAWGSLDEYVDDTWWANGKLYAGQNSISLTNDVANKNKTNFAGGWVGFGSSQDTTNADVWGMPTAAGGSSETGTCDYVNSNNTGILMVGGSYWSNYLEGGISKLTCNTDTESTFRAYGTRLAFVFDDDPSGIPVATLDHTSLLTSGGDTAGLLTSLVIEDGNTTYPDLGTTSDGFTHIGWYVDDVFYEKTAKVARADSHTAISVWKAPSIIITFMVEGNVHSTLEVPKGSVGVVYTPVMVTGVFAGWFYDQDFTEKYDATRALDSDVTLYAYGVPPLIFTSEPNASAVIASVDYGTFFFDATGSEGRYQIHWDFGDGNTSDEAIAYNTYSVPGKYTVTLTITNIYGDSSTAIYYVEYGENAAGGGGQ